MQSGGCGSPTGSLQRVAFQRIVRLLFRRGVEAGFCQSECASVVAAFIPGFRYRGVSFFQVVERIARNVVMPAEGGDGMFLPEHLYDIVSMVHQDAEFGVAALAPS